MKIKTFLQLALLFSILLSCSKEDLEPTIAQQKTVGEGISSAGDLKAILYGAYNRMTSHEYYGRNIIIYGEVRSDNSFPNGSSGRFTGVGGFNLLPTSGYVTGSWRFMYRVIASANIIINAPDNLKGEAKLVNHYKGQGYVMRALAHFDLLKTYGQQHTGGTLGVPYIKTYKGENLLPARNTVEEVKNFIIEDLKMAKKLLDPKFNNKLNQNITSYVPDALLSRVYLYFGMYPEARDAAKQVIDTKKFSIAKKADFVSSFSIDNPSNSIFSLAYSGTDNSGINGLGNIYRGGSYGDIQPLQNSINLFEDGDIRGKGGIIGKDAKSKNSLRNMKKYPSITGVDDIAVIRYEEIILNYAEALLKTGGDALTELNRIPKERGASAYTVANMDNILLERRKEFMFEGFRFHDLMRTKQDVKNVSNKQLFKEAIKYGDYRLAFPIPQAELDANSNMAQNKGY